MIECVLLQGVLLWSLTNFIWIKPSMSFLPTVWCLFTFLMVTLLFVHFFGDLKCSEIEEHYVRMKHSEIGLVKVVINGNLMITMVMAMIILEIKMFLHSSLLLLYYWYISLVLLVTIAVRITSNTPFQHQDKMPSICAIYICSAVWYL